jgi:hypothetical protein
MTGYKDVMVATSNMDSKLMNMQRKQVSRHSKVRTMKFFTSASMAAFTEDELIQIIFSEDREAGHRKIIALNAISDMIGINLLTSNDIFKDIKRVFADSDAPMTSFLNLIKNNLKTNSMDSVNMVTDSIDYGSSILNIKELYKTRSRPDMIYYDDTQTMSNLEMEGRMMTYVTTRSDNEVIVEATKIARESDNIYKIMLADSEIVAGCKLTNAFITNKDERIKSFMDSERVFYTPKNEFVGDNKISYHCYTTVKNHCIIEVNVQKKIAIGSVFVRDQMSLNNNNMLSMFMSQFLRYQKMGFAIAWRTKAASMIYRGREIFFESKMKSTVKVRLVKMRMKWSINIDVAVRNFTFTRRVVELPYGLDYNSFKMSMTNLSEDYMTLLSNKTMNIRQMNKMFLELGWVKNDADFWNSNSGKKVKVYTTKETMELLDSQTTEGIDNEGEALNFMLSDIMIAEDFLSDDEDEDEVDRDVKFNLNLDLPFGDVEKAMMKSEDDEALEEDLFGKNLKLEKLMQKIMTMVLKGMVKVDMGTIRFFAKMSLDRVGNLVFNSLRYVLSEFSLEVRLVEMIFFSIYKNLMMELKAPAEFTIELMDLVVVESQLNKMLTDGHPWPVKVVRESTSLASYGF